MLSITPDIDMTDKNNGRWRGDRGDDSSHRPIFFGPTPEYKREIHEQIFQIILNSKGGFTFSDVYNMPVYLRTFYLKRLTTF